MTYIANRNRISTVNSTEDALNTLDVFTGTWEDVTQYNSVTLAAKTDQDGTFTIHFSPDGVNADSTLTRYYRTNQIEPPHRFTVTRRYMRITFTNTSASNQTYLRLQTLLGDYEDLNAPLDSVISQDYDSASVRPTDYHYEVALSRRQGATTWNKFGYNSDIDTGVAETIWSQGGTFTRLNSASTFTVVSSSVQDILTTGTGAWNVIIYYVDANRKAQIEVIPLNGTTPVVSVSSGLGINRVSVYNTGSADSNVGNITITATTGGTVQAHMPATEGTTQQAIFFTQASHKFLIDWLFINVNKVSGGSSPRITVNGWVYSFISSAKYRVFYDVIDTSVENHIELKPSQPFIIDESSIIYFEASTDTNNSTCSVRFSGIEVKNINA